MDDGSWQGIAQIEGAQKNFTEAEKAWLNAIEKTTQIQNKIFYDVQLGFTEYANGKPTAQSRFEDALKLIGMVTGPTDRTQNTLLPIQKLVQSSNVHLNWLQAISGSDCPSFTRQFKRADSSFQKASLAADVADVATQRDLQGIEAGLDAFRNRRTACGGANESLNPAQRFCVGVTKISNAIKAGNIALYVIGAPSLVEYESNSRVRLPNTTKCEISSFDFRCSWPDREKESTANRETTTEQLLKSCTNLGPATVNRSSQTDNNLAASTASYSFQDRPDINVVRTFYKPAQGSSGHWKVELIMK